MSTVSWPVQGWAQLPRKQVGFSNQPAPTMYQEPTPGERPPSGAWQTRTNVPLTQNFRPMAPGRYPLTERGAAARYATSSGNPVASHTIWTTAGPIYAWGTAPGVISAEQPAGQQPGQPAFNFRGIRWRGGKQQKKTRKGKKHGRKTRRR